MSTHNQTSQKEDKAQASWMEKMKTEKRKMAQDGFMTYEEYKAYCQGLQDALQFAKRHNHK